MTCSAKRTSCKQRARNWLPSNAAVRLRSSFLLRRARLASGWFAARCRVQRIGRTDGVLSSVFAVWPLWQIGLQRTLIWNEHRLWLQRIIVKSFTWVERAIMGCIKYVVDERRVLQIGTWTAVIPLKYRLKNIQCGVASRKKRSKHEIQIEWREPVAKLRRRVFPRY